MTPTCECGCGQVPPPASRTRKSRGEVAGEPRRFVPGHSPAHHRSPAENVVHPASLHTPRVTREALHASLQPPNNCAVKAFLERLDPESRDVVEEALGYDAKDYPASALRSLLASCGFKDSEIPGNSAIQDHRNGRRPCRCKG